MKAWRWCNYFDAAKATEQQKLHWSTKFSRNSQTLHFFLVCSLSFSFGAERRKEGGRRKEKLLFTFRFDLIRKWRKGREGGNAFSIQLRKLRNGKIVMMRRGEIIQFTFLHFAATLVAGRSAVGIWRLLEYFILYCTLLQLLTSLSKKVRRTFFIHQNGSRLFYFAFWFSTSDSSDVNFFVLPFDSFCSNLINSLCSTCDSYWKVYFFHGKAMKPVSHELPLIHRHKNIIKNRKCTAVWCGASGIRGKGDAMEARKTDKKSPRFTAQSCNAMFSVTNLTVKVSRIVLVTLRQ